MSATFNTAMGTEARMARTRARFEDLEWILGSGVDLDRALERIGWSRQAFIHAARRHGRTDLLALTGARA